MDQYLNFISLEDDLFVLRRYSENSTFSYHAMNSPGTSDVAVNAMLDSIADGLFAVCATMGIVPIIRCPKGNAAEMVAKVRLLYSKWLESSGYYNKNSEKIAWFSLKFPIMPIFRCCGVWKLIFN